MSEYILTIKLSDGTKKQIDYTDLANKKSYQSTLSDTDSSYGQRIKALETAYAALGYTPKITNN